ncbi:MAG: DUF554 domain-containing protein [Oscillospiraceae bacterium]|nr:DUF554 domain-containing protein [Oscillospiraceae bacterium]
MVGLGTIVNVAAIIAGGGAGLVLKRFFPRRIRETLMQGIGLAVVIIGISGALSNSFTVIGSNVSAEHILIMIISLALGGLIGESAKIESRLDDFAKICENKFTKPSENSTFSKGLVTAALVFCVGSMSIIGAFEDGVGRNSDILFAKSVLDGITAMIFASTMGFGVIFSAIIVGLYQGLITLMSVFAAPYLSDVVVAQMSLIGSVLIMAIGFNLLHISKIKVGNLLPSVFVPVLYYVIKSVAL